KYFFDPGEGKNTPTIIAYCLALVSRVFERTAQRGASLILKLVKMFGFSIAILGGQGLNSDQEATLAGIPETIETLEGKFNLDVDCVPYAVCPKCSYTHAPSYPNDPSHPVYPSVCSERKAPSEEPCGASLLLHGKPLKIFEYYPFFDWFGKFLALPGIEEYGDKFCDTVCSHQTIPNDKTDQTDGRFFHEFRAHDGQLFIANRGEEGRWFFVFNADFFNVEGNRIRGKTSSTGMMAMSCLNLPLEIRNDHAYLYMPGIIRGPHEPNAGDAEHCHYLRPLIDDLVKGFTRGVRPYATFRTRNNDIPYGRNWKPLDDGLLRRAAEQWRNALLKDRKAIEELFGTRFSELWRLPYWRLCQMGIDPMHAMFLILLQRYFRDILGLDNPDNSKQTRKKPRFKLAFYHQFTPPPSLSSLVREMEVPPRRWSSVVGYVPQPTDENRLSLLDWTHLSPEHRAFRQTRLESLKLEITADSRAFQAVMEILNDLSEKAPETLSKKKVLYRKIHKQKWNVILYMCDNLAIFPDDRCPQHRASSKITKANVTKEQLTNILIEWVRVSLSLSHLLVLSNIQRINGIQETDDFECSELLTELSKSMNFTSALAIGNIHRVLQQPLARGEPEDELRKVLKKFPGDSLAFVCIDIERLPAGKFSKDDMVRQLMIWRMTKPLEQLNATDVDSSSLLQRIQQVVREVQTPTWVSNPPRNVGLYEAGTLKADHWRTLFSIHVPLATLSLWKNTSPLAATNASSMTSVVDTTMHLVCASAIMVKRKLSSSRRDQFRHLLRLHVLGLKKNFPGWIFPTHHLAFHIFDFMDLFSGVRHWWLFPFENLIGKLQRITTNHKPGEFEHTILHSFCKGASFRQWLMRPNAPPFLQYCQKLLDQAYNYDRRPEATPSGTVTPVVTSGLVISNFRQPISKPAVATSRLLDLLGTNPYESLTRIPAPKGDYTIPIEDALGNSFICFRPEAKYQPGQEWLAGQIQHIFRRECNGSIQFAVYRSQPACVADPFSDYWEDGFEAQIVS
ncbi:hypothetical protein GG344DRAFT_30407, partial [Lentinula edodes]